MLQHARGGQRAAMRWLLEIQCGPSSLEANASNGSTQVLSCGFRKIEFVCPWMLSCFSTLLVKSALPPFKAFEPLSGHRNIYMSVLTVL